jgi:broad specificity phosphatase PhoE
MSIKRIILIRPGETDWNRQGRWQGWAAAPLNAHGRMQVQRLCNFVRNIGMSTLFSSDLRRAEQTAQILADRLGFAPILDERLRERNIGNWQGLTMTEMQAWYPDQYQQLLADRIGFTVPGGESLKEVKTRVLAAFDDIIKQDKGETVGIISHTTAINLLLSEIIPGYKIGDTTIDNTAVTTIQREDSGDWKLIRVNDTLHLEGLETQSFKELGDRL